MTATLEVRNLTKAYGSVRAVDGATFEVGAGEIFGMVGPNGAGKTTTIECVEGLRRPDGGKIRVLGLDPQRSAYALRQRLGIQLQTAALPERLKVYEAIDLFGSLYRRRANADDLLTRLGLQQKAREYFGNLSGGQRQRLFIALALVNDPEVIFLDELTTGLDPQARRATWDLIRDIRDRGKTVFLTTHLMEEAEHLCDRVAIVDRGRIVALDTPAALVRNLRVDKCVSVLADGAAEDVLRKLHSVRQVERVGDRIVAYGKTESLVTDVVTALQAKGLPVRGLETKSPTLDDVFLALTGHEVRG